MIPLDSKITKAPPKHILELQFMFETTMLDNWKTEAL